VIPAIAPSLNPFVMAPNQSNLLQYENEDVEKVSLFEKKGYRTTPVLFVNGERVSEAKATQARPNQTLLSFLRDVLRLTGSKLGCAEGGCGACTVMLSKKNVDTGKIKHFSVNACLMPVLAADGCHVTTVEGIGTVKNDNLHPVQNAMVDMHGSQCGFCTPGIIVSIYALLANNPTTAYLEEHLDGNLCRCTGYRPIWDAARSLCDDGEELVKGPCGTACRECPEREACDQDCNVQDKATSADNMCCSSSKDKMSTYKETFLTNKDSWRAQPNVMFPKVLMDTASVESTLLTKPLMIVDRSEYHTGGTWFKPTTFAGLLALLQEFGGTGTGACKIVVGNTEVGIETRFKYAVYPRLISPSESIRELFGFEVSGANLIIGSCCPLSTIQHHCNALGEQDLLVRTVMPIHDMLRWFASTQIRNVACLGGNLVTASPISDMNPMLASMGAKLVIASLDATDKTTICRRYVDVSDFFVKYRTVDLKPTEVLERIEVPVLRNSFEYLKPFKQARRREDDISIVTSGMRLKLTVVDHEYIIEEASLAFGGMAPTTVLATETAKILIGSEFCAKSFESATEALLQELSLPEAVPGGQAAFRMTLATSFLYKFFLSVVADLKADISAIRANPAAYPGMEVDLPDPPSVDTMEESGTVNFLSAKKPNYSGVQVYPAAKVASGLEDKLYPAVKSARAAAETTVVGKASAHQSGSLHCTGEAAYCDDIPMPAGTLQACLVLARECGGVFEAMDVAEALAIPGVIGIYNYDSLVGLGGSNELGPIIHDETVFLRPGDIVRTVGQVLGIAVAETLEAAEFAARTVHVTCSQPKEKVVVTVEDAIETGSFYEFSRHSMERGDIAIIDSLATIADSTGTPSLGDVVKISGTFRSGAQEHFYLETNAALVIPSESDTNLTIYASTQAPTETQAYCASATGTPASKVVVRMKRMGGGFGGKETRSVFAACAAAVAAKCASRPIRLTLSRDVDMKITGTRHVFLSKYHASAQITENGAKLVAFDVKLFANGGSSFDLSGPVVDRALFHVDGVYMFPSFRAEGVPCKTVQAPHTAFRGFGGPQGMAVVEHVMDHLALATNVDADKLRRMNMYNDGEATPFGMIVGGHHSGNWNVPVMWDRLVQELDVPHRRERIAQFNAKHKWLKRGLCLIPTRFGIAFTTKFMNQGGALVHLYVDGTVLVTHGGTEMGQGLHTKVCQVAAQSFGIPLNDVYVNDTSTDKVANSLPTAASMSTDTYGMATLDACRQILKRLEPFREKLGADAPLKDVAHAAFFARVDLTAHGFFTVDDKRCGFDWKKERPEGFPDDKPANSWRGNPFNYFTQGVVCTEVEIDVLSGNHRTLQSDLLVDVGASINPAIDIGQIEGAFVQGMGWSTIEEVTYADDDHTWIRPRGSLFTSGPGTYKIPAFNDVPETFNVSLMDNVDNPFAVHSSKAIGEPPFFLGASVFYAIKDAVTAARSQNLGQTSYFEMRMPATSERIRMYCADPLASQAVSRMRSQENSIESFQPQGSY
jgi:xanthine dehydrogenase/oxidase